MSSHVDHETSDGGKAREEGQSGGGLGRNGGGRSHGRGGKCMKDNVFWVNSAAIVRGQEIHPIRYVTPVATGPDPFDLPSVSLIVPVGQHPQDGPLRIDCIESIDYPRSRFAVRLIADGIPRERLWALERRVSRLAHEGLEISLVCHPCYRGQIAVLDEEVSAAISDVVVLAELATPLPRDAFRKVARVHLEAAAVSVPPFKP